MPVRAPTPPPTRPPASYHAFHTPGRTPHTDIRGARDTSLHLPLLHTATQQQIHFRTVSTRIRTHGTRHPRVALTFKRRSEVTPRNQQLSVLRYHSWCAPRATTHPSIVIAAPSYSAHVYACSTGPLAAPRHTLRYPLHSTPHHLTQAAARARTLRACATPQLDAALQWCQGRARALRASSTRVSVTKEAGGRFARGRLATRAPPPLRPAYPQRARLRSAARSGWAVCLRYRHEALFVFESTHRSPTLSTTACVFVRCNDCTRHQSRRNCASCAAGSLEWKVRTRTQTAPAATSVEWRAGWWGHEPMKGAGSLRGALYELYRSVDTVCCRGGDYLTRWVMLQLLPIVVVFVGMRVVVVVSPRPCRLHVRGAIY